MTDNTIVKNKIKHKNVKYINDIYLEVLKESRNLIHKGYELLSHPMYSSIKPNETPYRSIILKKSNKLDTNSVLLIEEAIYISNKFQNNKQTPNWTYNVIDDFRVIDLDILSNTLERIQYIL
ncbi:GrdX family protein [Romboutsia sp. 1001216sp1]|uniref:GrdX family protein n=1 Tax=unclassified Romboutsia TaxID=2626894 RepID=UPI00232DF67C|nr:GrdX family protein [Romboutsia sp. 1001216sp1]MDB8792324.1 GrdX family protein [Romboutsia sp. 1001216sp1]MDB8795619.1 GrdX family protein [Romboutsia sp. 1001216sp1]MDB8798502.1 GrdX family protein [Romboutsia sp. 1001216sp1]